MIEQQDARLIYELTNKAWYFYKGLGLLIIILLLFTIIFNIRLVFFKFHGKFNGSFPKDAAYCYDKFLKYNSFFSFAVLTKFNSLCPLKFDYSELEEILAIVKTKEKDFDTCYTNKAQNSGNLVALKEEIIIWYQFLIFYFKHFKFEKDKQFVGSNIEKFFQENEKFFEMYFNNQKNYGKTFFYNAPNSWIIPRLRINLPFTINSEIFQKLFAEKIKYLYSYNIV